MSFKFCARPTWRKLYRSSYTGGEKLPSSYVPKYLQVNARYRNLKVMRARPRSFLQDISSLIMIQISLLPIMEMQYSILPSTVLPNQHHELTLGPIFLPPWYSQRHPIHLSPASFPIPLMPKERAVANEEALRSHETVELHEPVADVLKALGVQGEFALPGSGNIAIVRNPDFSWVKGSKQPRPKIIVRWSVTTLLCVCIVLWLGRIQNLVGDWSDAFPQTCSADNLQHSAPWPSELGGSSTDVWLHDIQRE